MYLSSSTTATAELWPSTPQGTLKALAAAAVLWAVAAVLLFVLAPGLETFPRLLLLSESVGLTMVACVIVLRRQRHLARLAPAPRWLVTGLVAIPVGYFAGHQIAFLLMGEPMRMAGNQQISLVPILATLLVGALGLHHYATREQLAQEAAARAEAQRLAVESQLRLLRAQLEPHMLFNTLANLRSLLREDVDRAESMIDQLIVYLRSTLAASQGESTTLGREFGQLQAYLGIMALRMGPRLSFRLELPAALEATPVPPMLLQPLVENAIKHGVEPQVGPGRVEVAARAESGGVEIRIDDSGLGLPEDEAGEPAARPTGASYGLQHVRARLQAVYGPSAQLRLHRRQPTGVSAVVFIPATPERPA